MWALTRIVGNSKSTSASAVIRRALDDRAGRVRHVAARSLATYPDREVLPRLIELLHTDDSPVRREAAKALGRSGDAIAVPALLSGLAHCADRDEEHALIYALIELNAVPETTAGLMAESAAVRK